MEQHPVPQNVTTFQFRLIGDMTLKQFGYLCAGGILGFVSYKLPLPFFFTWPAAVAFILLGIGFAFVPVEERPMDVWVFSFFKSIYSPTQYIWSQSPQADSKKRQPSTPAPTVQPTAAPAGPAPSVTGKRMDYVEPAVQQQVAPPAAQPAVAAKIVSQSPAPSAHAQSILSGLFSSAPHQSTPPQAAPPPAAHAQVVASHPKLSLFEQIMQWLSPPPSPAGPTRVISANSAPAAAPPSVTGKRMDYVAPAIPARVIPTIDTSAATQTMNRLEGTVHQLQSELATQEMTESRVVELQKQLTEVLSERSKMEDELAHLRRQMTDPLTMPDTKKAVPQAATDANSTSRTPPTVSVINSQAAAVKAGLPRLTNIPNVISGIIKDDANNFLPAILVTVTSKDNMPMRALKTNKLGQFAASTPLPNDTYVVEAEDPRGRYTFDRAQITLNGQVVPGIEIVAKSQKQLVREQLSEQIFGKNQT